MSTAYNKRKTKQKITIDKWLENNKEQYFTAEELFFLLMKGDTPVGRATVYRYLNTLEEEGVLRRYTLKGELSCCYQYIGDEKNYKEHYHLLCDNCGRIIHFSSEELEVAFKSLEENGLSFDQQRTVFYGKCKVCTSDEG
ncbi:hypothetical protein AZF37_04150 [endosymbiont 'TC1' of Trimyema compressum]|uniref:Fur family transcriptional regulator n=1 Tax=endosymbiont 'TC1' of Trimyema compressum TaxID=243899 RepID=UPI0007F12115|nr:transcriptional repressor [endosymbiont 'TC1' of Trimyema compressum]AMP20467.1 hypothetical protein AZF37_04150 [endosymbiont 'TC1' of Trimyema compressum]